MRHIFFVNHLEQLNLKKDSSLMLASTLKNNGQEVVLWFENDFFLSNKGEMKMRGYDFNFEFYPDGCYLKKFEIGDELLTQLTPKDVIHMRIDPPFDTRYLRYLWMLRFFQSRGIKVVNSPDGILKFNEKLYAYEQTSSLLTYVGSSVGEFAKFISSLKQQGHNALILKPLDLFQGMGVEKLSLNDSSLEHKFTAKVLANHGPIVAQAFCEEVINGEIRSLYFKGKELGSILKVPQKGEFLANIAQGASFSAIELSSSLKKECDHITAELLKEGVDWVAFDIMGEHVSEINITCPGLLVEVSFAHQKNLALEIAKYF